MGKGRLSPYWSIGDWARGEGGVGKRDLVGVGDVAVRRTFCAEGKVYVYMYV